MKTIIKCDNCGVDFCQQDFRKWAKKYNHIFCSHMCFSLFQTKTNTIKKPCKSCGKVVSRKKAQFKKSKTGNIFCNSSCNASYNNTLKRKSRRSKCEKLLYDLLQKEFPTLTMLPNDKITLNGYEIDVYIPSIKLGIEWNGIVHFKPIYGQTKLDKIQQRDAEKQQRAISQNINLIVIPDLVSTKKKVHEAFADIGKIIQQLL